MAKRVEGVIGLYCKNCGRELAEGMRFCVACGEPVQAEPSEETAGSQEEVAGSKDARGDVLRPEDERSDPNAQGDSTKADSDQGQEAEKDRATEPEGDQEPEPNDAAAPAPDREPEPEGDQAPEDDCAPEPVGEDAPARDREPTPNEADAPKEDRAPEPKDAFPTPEQEEATAQETPQQIPASATGPAPAADAGSTPAKRGPMIFAAVAVAMLTAAIVVAVVGLQPGSGTPAIGAVSATSGGASTQTGNEGGSSSTSDSKADAAKKETEDNAKKEAEEKAKKEAEAAARAEEEARKAEEERRSQAVADAESRGLQAFTGTVMVGTFKDIAEYEGGQSLKDYNIYGRKPNDTAAILVLDSSQSVSLESFGSSYLQEVSHFSLAISDSGINYRWPYEGAVGYWEQYDGERVVVAGNPTIPAGETFPVCPLLYDAEVLYAE